MARPTFPAPALLGRALPALLGGALPALLSGVLLALLGGCALIDQRTFNPRAGLGPEPPPMPGPGAAPPLVSIDFAKPDAVFEEALRRAVDDAVARKPTVAFDVVTVVPATGTVEQQANAAGSIRGDAREVARIIADEGADPDGIHLLARGEPGAVGLLVQVYVH